tara:strand:- start:4429 stop:5853 length:1425 start_codon:yes stop_codon:yes gene_type:complete
MAYSYGTGTANQFTDGTQRQVLELGNKIHYYNPSVTPILSVSGRAGTRIAPVPIFEWMEDEYMIKKSVSVTLGSSSIANSTTSGSNNTGTILNLNRQAQMEMFEVGGVYTVSASGGDASVGGMQALQVIAVGKNAGSASPTDKSIQVIGFDNISGSTYTYDQHGSGTAVLSGTSGTITFEFAGIAQTYSDGTVGFNATQQNVDNDATVTVSGLSGYAEGAGVSKESRKKVRRLKNCTQIFREPYTITGTAQASKHYGGSELSRLQARKLAKIKGDIEWALLTNGDISLDATAENPTRTFAGLGVGQSGAGVIQSFDGTSNTDMQLSNSSGALNDFDGIVEAIFHDMVSGSMKKTVFASNKWMKKLVAMVRASGSGITLEGKMGADETAGLRVSRYYGPVGELEFIPHPYLNGTLEDYAVAIDFSNVEFRPLTGRNMQLRSDIVQDGSDGRTDEWLIEAGPEIRNEQTHAIMKLT